LDFALLFLHNQDVAFQRLIIEQGYALTVTDQVIHEPHRRERFRWIGFSFIASVLARGLVITTPLTLHSR
jgi:hypothetical protein